MVMVFSSGVSTGGAGTDAPYPACSTAAISSSTGTGASECTRAFSVAKLTVASTPGSLFSFRSTRVAHDALGDHARDELEISSTMTARPVQAALTSAAAFAAGAALPLLVAAVAPASSLLVWVSGTALVFLALLGGVAAHTGGAGVLVGAWRVTFWGALAMAITAGVGALFGAPV